MNSIKYEIIILTYNQQNLIEAAIYSAAKQTLSPYLIRVIDDCSSDDTFLVAQKVANRFKEIKIDVRRNDYNLGIFKNFNEATKIASGDIVCILAGDDELNKSYLSNLNNYILVNGINIHKPIWIISSIIEINSLGDKRVVDYSKYREEEAVELLLSQSIRTFEIGLSLPAFKNSFIDEDTGYQADNLKSLRVLKESKVYFAPFVGYQYKVSTGVTTRTNRRSYLISRKRNLELFKLLYNSSLNKREYRFLYYELLKVNKELSPSLCIYIKFLLCTIRMIIMPRNHYGTKRLLSSLLPYSFILYVHNFKRTKAL